MDWRILSQLLLLLMNDICHYGSQYVCLSSLSHSPHLPY
jgi:hypothetical protein